MRILQFGTFNAFDFEETQGDDDWITTRPSLAEQIGGAGGAFDFYGDTANPPAPIIVTKRFTLTSTYDGIETLLDTLRAATIAASSRTFLWGLPRGGSAATVGDWRFANAKCISGPGTPEKFEEGNFVKAPVELIFFCQEGIWHGEVQFLSAAYTTGNTFQMTNDGNYPAMATILVTPSGSSMTSFKLEVDSPDPIQPEFTFTGTVSAGTNLDIDTAAYSVLNNGVGAYTDLADGIGTGQVAWLWVMPGTRTFTVTFTGGSPATVAVTFNDTYLM